MIWTSLIAQGKRRQWMSLLVATLVALVFLHLARFYQGEVSTWILAALSILVAANLLRAGLSLAYRLDRHPFRLFDLGIKDDRVAPGSALEVELVLEARRAVTLRRLSAELRAKRQKSTGSGRQVRILYQEAKSIERGLPLERGQRKCYPVSFLLPSSAPYSFRSMEGKIVWAVHVEVEVDGWGALEDELEITVAPA